MEMALRVGRGVDDRDSEKAEKVVAINETAARKYVANQIPIGQHFGSSPEQASQLEVVGVLRDAKYDSARDPVPPTMYVPYLQTRMPNAIFQVRTAAHPARASGPIRETGRKVDPKRPLLYPLSPFG